MNNAEMIRKAESFLQKHGQVTVCGENSGFGLVFPIAYKNKVYLYSDALPLGRQRFERYSYYGTPSVPLHTLASGTVLTVGEKKYLLEHGEEMRLGEDICYIFAVLSLWEEDGELTQ